MAASIDASEGIHLPPIIVEPSAPHHSSVIMLHGMYCDGTMFEALPGILAQHLGERAAGTRFIFANSPIRTIDWPSGIRRRAYTAGTITSLRRAVASSVTPSMRCNLRKW